jgi:hypothetical protein
MNYELRRMENKALCVLLDSLEVSSLKERKKRQLNKIMNSNGTFYFNLDILLCIIHVKLIIP